MICDKVVICTYKYMSYLMLDNYFKYDTNILFNIIKFFCNKIVFNVIYSIKIKLQGILKYN